MQSYVLDISLVCYGVKAFVSRVKKWTGGEIKETVCSDFSAGMRFLLLNL